MKYYTNKNRPSALIVDYIKTGQKISQLKGSQKYSWKLELIEQTVCFI